MAKRSSSAVTSIGICYAADDSMAARRLAHLLRQEGYTLVQIAPVRSEPDAVKRLQRAVAACDCSVLLLSPNAMRSATVRSAVQLLRQSKKPIIPVITQTIPPQVTMPFTNSIDATDGIEVALPQIRRQLHALSRPRSSKQPQQATFTTLVTRVAQMISAVAVVLSTILIVYLIATPAPDFEAAEATLEAFQLLPLASGGTTLPVATNMAEPSLSEDGDLAASATATDPAESSSGPDADALRATDTSTSDASVTAASASDGEDATGEPIATTTSSPTDVPPPVAVINASAIAGVAPLSVNFTSESIGAIDQHRWDFNGDSVADSTDVTPGAFTYTTAGTYTVSLVVTGSGGSDQATVTITVTQPTPTQPTATLTPTEPPPPTMTPVPPTARPTATPRIPQPTARIMADVTSGTVPLQVRFTSSVTGQIDAWSWDLDGDGDTDSRSANSTTYTFESPGDYRAALQVSGPGGTSATSYVDITVDQVPAPVASFTASTTNGTAPLEVRFTNTSMGVITGYEWDFESDGEVDSTEASPSYIFTESREYRVTLRAIGPGGVSKAPDVSVFVSPPDLDRDDDGVNDLDDCAPDDPTIYRGAPEIPDDGIDQDCDGADLVIDRDGDGFKNEDDCGPDDASIYPGAPEVADDGIDQNCDGEDDVTATQEPDADS